MIEALNCGEVALVGLARPLCIEPDLPQRLFSGEAQTGSTYEKTLRLGSGWLGPNSPIQIIRKLNSLGQGAWFGLQVIRMGDGFNPNLRINLLNALFSYQRNELRMSKALAKK